MTNLPLHIARIKSEVVKSFCLCVTGFSKYLSFGDKVCEKTWVIGDVDVISKYFETVSELCSVMFSQVFTIRTFQRLLTDNQLYVSSSYTKGSRLSSYCRYNHDNAVSHGNILTFVKVSTDICSKYFALTVRSTNLPTELENYVQFSDANQVIDLVPVINMLNITSWSHETYSPTRYNPNRYNSHQIYTLISER